MDKRQLDWDRVQATNPIVRAALNAGLTERDIIVLLSDQASSMTDHLMRLEAIAPRKFKLKDGRVFIYRCPDNLVPEAVF